MCYTEKSKNSSEGTQKHSSNFGQASILLKLAGLWTKKKKSKAMPQICATVSHSLNSSLSPTGMWADSRQGKKTVQPHLSYKKELKQWICSQ